MAEYPIYVKALSKRRTPPHACLSLRCTPPPPLHPPPSLLPAPPSPLGSPTICHSPLTRHLPLGVAAERGPDTCPRLRVLLRVRRLPSAGLEKKTGALGGPVRALVLYPRSRSPQLPGRPIQDGQSGRAASLPGADDGRRKAHFGHGGFPAADVRASLPARPCARTPRLHAPCSNQASRLAASAARLLPAFLPTPS